MEKLLNMKQILNKLVQDTVKSVAFSRKFGANGQGIRNIIKDIDNELLTLKEIYSMLECYEIFKDDINISDFSGYKEIRRAASLVLW